MNLFTRKKSDAAELAPPGIPPTFLALPPLVTNFDSTHLYIVPRVRVRDTGAITHLDNAARAHSRGILLGAPGMGKSSALEFIAAQTRVPTLSYADYSAQGLPDKFPNESMILLDDVSEPAHVAQLQALAKRFPQAHIWAATHDPHLVPESFTALELLALNEREIVSFAESWFPLPQVKGHPAKRINRAAQDFVASLQANAGTRALATVPFYLFLLLQVYKPDAPADEPVMQERVTLPMVGGNAAGGNAATPFTPPQRTHVAALPAHRARLFDEYVNAKLAAERDPDLAARAIEGIALSTERGQRATTEHLARGYGLVEERPDGRVEFKHSLLRDFLAARALRRNPDFGPLRERLNDPAWREVVLFYAGLGAADEVAAAALENDDLEFAASILAATREPNAEQMETTVKGLAARAWDDHDQRAMRALGELRSNLASDFFAAKLRDKNADVRLRAAFILGKLHTDRSLEYLLPQLRDPSDDVRVQVIASLGASHSERVIEPLLVALRGDPRVATTDTRLKIAAAQALGEYGTDKAVPALIVDIQVGDADVREQAAAALVKIRSDFAVKPLTEIAETDKKTQVRQAAVRVLDDMRGK